MGCRLHVFITYFSLPSLLRSVCLNLEWTIFVSVTQTCPACSVTLFSAPVENNPLVFKESVSLKMSFLFLPPWGRSRGLKEMLLIVFNIGWEEGRVRPPPASPSACSKKCYPLHWETHSRCLLNTWSLVPRQSRSQTENGGWVTCAQVL